MHAEKPLQVLLADDHAMVRDGLRRLIEVDWPEARFDEACDQPGTLAALARQPAPDLAVIDVRMPGMRGAESFAQFRRANPATPIVVVTGLDDPGLRGSLLAHGANEVISKEASGEQLLAALHRVLGAQDGAAAPSATRASAPAQSQGSQGSQALSQRQRDILRLLHEGLPNKLIARRLGIEESTVKGHLHGLYRALDVRGRTEAMAQSRDWLL